VSGDLLSADYQGKKKSSGGFETINLASVRPDDISLAVISTVRMCEYEICEASSLMLVGHPRLSSGCTKMHGISVAYVRTVAARSLP